MCGKEALSNVAGDRLCIGLLICLIVWFCQELLVGEAVPFFRDLSTYFYPLRYILFESFASGTLPLWNRHVAMGFPVLADFQSAAFYPPHLLFALSSFFSAIRALFILHFLVAALGSYMLLRYWSYPFYLSMLGALLFTLGGTIVSLSNLLNHFQTAVWLPWIVLASERVIRSTTFNKFLTFAFILTLQFLAGSPDVFALSAIVILLNALRLKGSSRELSLLKILGIFVTAGLVVLGLTLIQVLPTIELFLESRRSQPLPSSESLRWSLEPRRLLNLFVQSQEIDLTLPVGIRFFFAKEASFFISYYLGAISAFGICFWLCLGPKRQKVGTLCLLTLSLVAAFGQYTPVYPSLMSQWPVLATIRFPEKFFFISYVVFIYTAVRGIAEFLAVEKREARPAILIASLICTVGFGIYLYILGDYSWISGLVVDATGLKPRSLEHLQVLAGVFSSIERQVILSLALLFIFMLARYERIRPGVLACLLVGVTFVDLAWAHRGYLFAVKPDFVSSKVRVLRETNDPPARIFYYPSSTNLHPSSWAIQGRPPFKDVAALFSYNLLPNQGVFHKFDYFQEIDALARRPYTEFLGFANQLPPVEQVRLLAAFNVKYIVSFAPLSIEGIKLVTRFPEHYSWLYQVEQPTPRVYVVGNAVVETDSRSTLLRLSSSAFDPRKEVILDRSPGIPLGRKLVWTAEMLRYEHQAVSIRASSDGSGVLVLADSYYPGWKAYVNGREAEILRANHFFRAVVLDRGEHIIEFRYEPASFRIGRFVSAVTLLALAIIWLYVARSKTYSRRQTA